MKQFDKTSKNSLKLQRRKQNHNNSCVELGVKVILKTITLITNLAFLTTSFLQTSCMWIEAAYRVLG